MNLQEKTLNSEKLKNNLRNYYNTEANIRDGKSVKANWKVNVREKFAELLKHECKSTLLELGAGAGYDSLYFMENGFNVVAIDLSIEMVNKCIEKGIEVYELDFYKLSSLNRNFDSIYAINTLLHVPKSDLLQVLKEINNVLNNNGLFYMGLYGGSDKENEWVKSDVSDIPRFFSFHSEQYLRSVLENIFEIIDFEQIKLDDKGEIDIFHSITLRKKIVIRGQ